MKDLSVNEILIKDATKVVTQSQRIAAEDKAMFLRMQARQLYKESHDIQDTGMYIHRESISTMLLNNLRLCTLVGFPTAFIVLAAIVDSL
jgi:hypothetical protein